MIRARRPSRVATVLGIPVLGIPVLVIPVLLATLAACGSSKTQTSDTTSSTAAAQTYEIVSPAKVAAGLATARPLVKAAALLAGAGGAKADAAVTTLYDTWYTFEGTIRKTDQAVYLDMEDALVAIKAGAQQKDAAKATKGAADFLRLSDQYLAKFPAKSVAESPSSDSTPGTASGALVPAPGAGAPVAVQLGDYAVVVAPKLAIGSTTFEIANVGKQTHEFIVLRTDLDPPAFPVDAEGRFVENAPGLTAINEKEGIKPGTNATLTVNLPAGNYVFACNLLGHFKKGMAVKVRVG